MSVKPKIRKLSGYEAAQSGAAFFLHTDPGYIRISGGDKLDFLQRQTTNDILRLLPGRVLRTVLTSPTARIHDVFYVFLDDAEGVCIITLSAYGEKTLNYLKRRIFFNDKVVLTDSSHEFAQIDIEGPAAHESLLQIGLDNPIEIGEIVDGEFEGNKLRVFSKIGLSNIGYKILVNAEHLQSLLDAMASVDMVRISAEDYEIKRVELGIPAGNRELIEDYTPLEVNLHGAISDNKGCYTGQEVIARQVNYDKITRRLVGLYLNGVVPNGARVSVSDKPVGEVTSIVQSPKFKTIALGVIKRPYYEPGTRVKIKSESKVVDGMVSGLPFEGE